MEEFFGAKLKEAVEAGKVSMSEIDDHARRVLRSEFAGGIVDYPTQKGVVDVEGNLETARKIEEQSIVLLKNWQTAAAERRDGKVDRGDWAERDNGMISGGGSAQVDPPGGRRRAGRRMCGSRHRPLTLQAKAPGAKVQFDSGANLARRRR